MAGYQTIEALRPIMHRGPVPTPVVDRALVRPPAAASVVIAPAALPQSRSWSVTNKQRALMREQRQRGVSLHAIAREVGVTHSTVRYHTDDIRPPMGGWSKGGHKKRVNPLQAQRLRRQGLTYKAIGAVLGCSEGAAHRHVNGRRGSKRGKLPRVTVYVQLISEISGVPCCDLRAPLRGMPKKGNAEVCKARALLFWVIAAAVPRMNQQRVARALGGFAGTTVGDGIRRVERAIEALGVSVPSVPARLPRKIWPLEWPRPSA